MNFEDLPKFTPDKPKLIAAILFLMEEAAKTGVKLSKFEIVKSLFLADDAHLSQFGRPVTFDNYGAMTHGPVGDLASDLLNDYKITWIELGLSTAPWTSELVGNRSYYSPSMGADRAELSTSDTEALLAAMTDVLRLGFKEVSNMTHAHPAWVAAWANKSEGVTVAAMDWRKFNSVDADMVLNCEFASRFPT